MNWAEFIANGTTPALALTAGIFLSVQLEALTKPCCPGWSRPPSSIALHAGLFLVTWAGIMIVCNRPFFSVLALLAAQFLVVQISNAKFRALREPFIFSDQGCIYLSSVSAGPSSSP